MPRIEKAIASVGHFSEWILFLFPPLVGNAVDLNSSPERYVCSPHCNPRWRGRTNDLKIGFVHILERTHTDLAATLLIMLVV